MSSLLWYCIYMTVNQRFLKLERKLTILIFVYETKIVLAFLSTLASVIINIGEWSEKYCVKWQKLLRTICRLAEISYKCHHKHSVQKNLSGFPNYRKIFQFYSWSKLWLSKWNDLSTNVLSTKFIILARVEWKLSWFLQLFNDDHNFRIRYSESIVNIDSCCEPW